MLRICLAMVVSLCSATLHAFNPSTDLVSLHYDHAPDPDDGHAAVAGLIVTRHYGLSPHVIGGAYGIWNRDRFVHSSIGLMNTIWGSNWVDAHSNWNGAISQTVNRWRSTL